MWYRFAAKPMFLKNPFDFSFWVCVSDDCKEPIENPNWIEIKPEFTNSLSSWSKLLSSSRKSINTQEKLTKFLESRIKDYKGKIIYKTYLGKKLKNEMGEFYIYGREESIKQNEEHGVMDWMKLLSTDSININTQEKLTKFLELKIRYDDDLGTKIYKPFQKGIILKNEIGEFYIYGIEESIKQNEEHRVMDWAKLLSTDSINVNTQEKLTKFLESKITIVNGKRIYKPFQKRIIKLKNEIGEFYIEGRQESIKQNEEHGVKDWKKLLRTNERNVNTQEKLTEYLDSKITIVNGKRIYKPFQKRIIKLKNEIGEFYIDGREESIKQNEEHGIMDWAKLLSTDSININTQEKLTKFLESKIRYDDDLGKRIYKSFQKRIIKLKNEIGEFYIEGREESIKADAEYVITNWKKLLSTNFENINTQEKLTKLLESRTEDYKGKKIYKRYRDNSIKLKNEIGEFYINGREESIKQNDEYGVVVWAKLLSTNFANINTQEKLTKFLESRTEDYKGKKIYKRFEYVKLKNEIGEFYIDGIRESIKENEEHGINYWTKLLRTDSININTQEKLTQFLKINKRQIDEKTFYFPYGASYREKLLRDILESSIPEHNFTILYNKNIPIFYSPDPTKIKLLRFDSVIYDNEKPILIIEIHGSQHYKYVPFDKSSNKYNNWQKQILNDIIKMNYCYDNQIPIIYLNHYLTYEEFKTICNNIKTNPHFYDQFIPGKPYLFQKDPNNNLGHVRSYDFENDKKIYTMRLIHSHFYPIFSGLIDLEENRLKTKIKDTLISIAKLVGLFESNYNTENFDNLDYIKNFNYETNLTENYNYCVNIFNELFRDKIYIDFEDNITYKNVSEARKRKLFKPTVEPNISEENSVLAYNIKILRI